MQTPAIRNADIAREFGEIAHLLDTHCRMARDEGVLACISPDARSAPGFERLRHGVGQARRGWPEPVDVLNTRPPAGLQRLVHQASKPMQS